MDILKGIAASSGIAIGNVTVMKEQKIEITSDRVTDREAEKRRFKDAVHIAKSQLERLKSITEQKMGEDKARIFEAHLLMLEDPELIGAVESRIESEGVNGGYALSCVIEMYVSIFEQMDNEYMRERAGDIKDIGRRVQNILAGIENVSMLDIGNSIVAASDLAPSDTAQMDKNRVLGIVTDIGGRTSHSAIMARTMGIPAVVGLGHVTASAKSGDIAIVDGDEGIVIINPGSEVIENYREKQKKNIEMKKMLSSLKSVKSVTKDGRHVELASNIGTVEDAGEVIKNGGEGIGLFRTEFLYMNSDSLPTEEEQFEAYSKVARIMGEKPVVIRTLDIGGDKKLKYLPMEEEMNPFLGYRAIRLCLDRKDIFRTQLRAVLRASVYGNIKVMFPMISSLQELKEAKSVVEGVKNELNNENIPINDKMEIGIMVEIPSAAVISDVLAKEVDFFSIGTNDLMQYTLAVDRMNQKVSKLYDPFHPAVLRLIKTVIDNGHREGKWVGMCGEMAGDTELIPVLLGFGLDEFSMSPSSLLMARKIIRESEFEKAKKLSEGVLTLGSSEEIKDCINRYK